MTLAFDRLGRSVLRDLYTGGFAASYILFTLIWCVYVCVYVALWVGFFFFLLWLFFQVMGSSQVYIKVFIHFMWVWFD